MNPETERFKDMASASRAAADFIIAWCRRRIEETDRFTLVLSGGRTPRRLYRLLGRPDYALRMDWAKVHLFWGDERCVPFGDPRSNYGMSHEALISKIPIPAGNVHRVPVDRPSPHEAALAYEDELGNFFGPSGLPPAFDLVLLGVGDDGHTASLFPGDAVLAEHKRWVAAVTAPGDIRPRQRVTLTLPVLNRAGGILFLVALPGKEKTVNAILRGAAEAAGYPAAMITAAPVQWFLAEEQ